MKQIINEMKQQPLVSVISVIGTALAIFLIMVVVMLQQVRTAPFAPESNRDRMLHWRFTSIRHSSWGEDASSNGPMSYATFKEMFLPLTTPETVTAYKGFPEKHSAALPGEPAVSIKVRDTDAAFFKVFNFDFVDGAPYSQANFEAGIPEIVISEAVARDVFKTTDGVVGRELLLDMTPYKVVGVVKEVNSLASKSYSDAWVPFTTTGLDIFNWNDNHMGMLSATILAKNKSDFAAIRAEIDKQFAAVNSRMKNADGYEFIRRNRPYDQETDVAGVYANVEPDVKGARRNRYIIYAILILVPAINLSSMTRSRLRKRTAEIGVRRAFGASSGRIALTLIYENMLVTLAAGAIGLILCLMFAWLCAPYLFQVPASTMSIGMLVQLSTFGMALGFCFILNLLCSAWPAWKSSRESIVESLSGNNR